jgi:hypothetical protein
MALWSRPSGVEITPRRIVMHRRVTRAFVAAAMMSTLGCAAAFAQHSSTITYQGALHLQGEPYTGTADYAFRLWTAESDGQVASGLVQISGVQVEEGLFQVPLDFGAEALRDDRWIAISVRTPAWDGQGAEPPFTTLPGRQRLTASPYSIQTRGVFVNEAGDRVGIGTSNPAATLHVAGAVRADGGVRFPGGAITNVLTLTGPANLGPLSSGGESGFIVPVNGAAVGDAALATLNPLPPELAIMSIRVESAGQVFIRVRNISNMTYDAPPMTIKVIVFKQ